MICKFQLILYTFKFNLKIFLVGTKKKVQFHNIKFKMPESQLLIELETSFKNWQNALNVNMYYILMRTSGVTPSPSSVRFVHLWKCWHFWTAPNIHHILPDLWSLQTSDTLGCHYTTTLKHPTLREEPSQINVILQQKLLAAKLSAVCTVYKQWLYVLLSCWWQLWLKNHCKNTRYYSIFQLSLLLLFDNYQYNCNNIISSVSRLSFHLSVVRWASC